MGTVTLISCSRPSSAERCPCGNVSDRRCDAPLCKKCRVPRKVGDLCAAHAKIHDAKAGA